MLMENKNQIKLIEVNGKSYKIDTKIYIPAGEMKEIIIACHGFAGDKESSAIEALADEMNRNNVGVICFDFPVTCRYCMQERRPWRVNSCQSLDFLRHKL